MRGIGRDSSLGSRFFFSLPLLSLYLYVSTGFSFSSPYDPLQKGILVSLVHRGVVVVFFSFFPPPVSHRTSVLKANVYAYRYKIVERSKGGRKKTRKTTNTHFTQKKLIHKRILSIEGYNRYMLINRVVKTITE